METPGARSSSGKVTVTAALDWKPLRLNARPAARRACAAGLFRDCDGAAPVCGCTTKTKAARRAAGTAAHLAPLKDHSASRRPAPLPASARDAAAGRPAQVKGTPGQPGSRAGAPVLPVGPVLVPYGVGARGVKSAAFSYGIRRWGAWAHPWGARRPVVGKPFKVVLVCQRVIGDQDRRFCRRGKVHQ